MNQVEALQSEISRLRGQLEVLSNGLENAQKRQRDMYLDLDTRLRRIEQQGGDAAPRRKAAPPISSACQALSSTPQPTARKSATAVGDLDARIKRLEQQCAAARDHPAPVSSHRLRRRSPTTPPVTPVKADAAHGTTAGTPAPRTPAPPSSAAAAQGL